LGHQWRGRSYAGDHRKPYDCDKRPVGGRALGLGEGIAMGPAAETVKITACPRPRIPTIALATEARRGASARAGGDPGGRRSRPRRIYVPQQKTKALAEARVSLSRPPFACLHVGSPAARPGCGCCVLIARWTAFSVQVPLPGHIDSKRILLFHRIRPRTWTVFHPENLGRLLIASRASLPARPTGS